MSTASWKKFWANGISKKAIAGIPVLGTVAHFLPTLSMTKPAGKIIANTIVNITIRFIIVVSSLTGCASCSRFSA